ncbi:MAG: hypothetical protein Q7S53_01335 [bacterium]|nr:hypothetical protein [bacterium]
MVNPENRRIPSGEVGEEYRALIDDVFSEGEAKKAADYMVGENMPDLREEKDWYEEIQRILKQRDDENEERLRAEGLLERWQKSYAGSSSAFPFIIEAIEESGLSKDDLNKEKVDRILEFYDSLGPGNDIPRTIGKHIANDFDFFK